MARNRASASPTPIVVPESRVTGPIGKSSAPMTVPATTTVSAVTPTNSPFWLTWSRKAGPRPGRGDDDSRMATAIRIGMAASASSSA
jgi:hypothetical protein